MCCQQGKYSSISKGIGHHPRNRTIQKFRVVKYANQPFLLASISSIVVSGPACIPSCTLITSGAPCVTGDKLPGAGTWSFAGKTRSVGPLSFDVSMCEQWCATAQEQCWKFERISERKLPKSLTVLIDSVEERRSRRQIENNAQWWGYR